MMFQWLVACAFMLTSSIRIRHGSPAVLSESDTGILTGVNIPAKARELKSMPRAVQHLGKLLELRTGSDIDFNHGQTLWAELHSSVTDVVRALSSMSSNAHAIKGHANLASQHAASAVAELLADVHGVDIVSVVRTSLVKMHQSVSHLETEGLSLGQLADQFTDVLQRSQQLLIDQKYRYTSCLFKKTRAGAESLEPSNCLCADRDAPETKVDTSGICAGATKNGRLSVNEAIMQERCAKDTDCEGYAVEVNAGLHDFIPLVSGDHLAGRPEFKWQAWLLGSRSVCTGLLMDVRTWENHSFQDALTDFETKGATLRQAIEAISGVLVDLSEVRKYVTTPCKKIPKVADLAADLERLVQEIFKHKEQGYPFAADAKLSLEFKVHTLKEMALSVRLLSRAFAEVDSERLLQPLSSLLTLPVDSVLNAGLLEDLAQMSHDASGTVEAVASQLRIEVAEFVAGNAAPTQSGGPSGDVAEAGTLSADMLGF